MLCVLLVVALVKVLIKLEIWGIFGFLSIKQMGLMVYAMYFCSLIKLSHKILHLMIMYSWRVGQLELKVLPYKKAKHVVGCLIS